MKDHISPIPVVLRIAIIFFAVEGLIMLAFDALSPTLRPILGTADWVRGVVDALALVLFSSPIVYFLVIRPYILARSTSEAVLRENENRLNEAQRIAQIGSWELDLKRNVLTWSDEIYRIFEIDPVRFGASYEAFLDAIHPDDRAMVDRAYTGSLKDRTPYEITHRLWFADDRIKWVHERCETDFDAEGNPLISRGTVQDVTNLKRAEEALRESESQLRLVTDAMPAMILYVDRDYQVRFANQRAADWFGFPRDEVLGRHIQEIRGRDAFEASRPYMDQLFNAGQGSVEQGERFQDGELRNFEAIRAPDFGPDGVVRGYYSLVLDTTERKRVEERLMLAQFTLEQGGDAVFWLGENGEYKYANQSALRMLGYSWDELCELRLWDVDPAVTQASWPEVWGRVGHRDRHAFEAIHITKSGEALPVEVTTNVIRFRGHHILCAFSRDIAGRKQAEEKLRQAQKMEAVGRLTGGIAHEFNNLLMVIIGNLELAMQPDTEAEARRPVSLAMKSAVRAAELTKQLLAFSRKQELVIRNVDLNALTRDMREMIQQALGETISVDMQLGDEIWPILSDEVLLESVLLNLCLNARDAMPGGGRIEIVTSNETVGAARGARHGDPPPGDYVMLEVADTGSGMPPEVLEHVFEPFFTTKDVGQGTGLGLSMIHGFVEQSGGSIKIASEVGRGTRIRIFLPRASEPESAPAGDELASAVAPQGGLRILVVEDDPDVREVVVGFFAQFGCVLFEAEDGRSALAKLEACGEIDVLFTDVVLPGGMNGPDLAREVRRRFPQIRLVFTSGYPDGELNKLVSGDDQHLFIRKPYQRVDLARLLEKLVNG